MDRVEHLLEIIYLLRHFIRLLFLFRNGTYKKSDVRSEFLLYIIDTVSGILHHIMKKSCYDRVDTQFKIFCHNRSDSYWMNNIWFSGLSFLGAMSLTGQFVRCPDPLFIDVRKALQIFYFPKFIN